MIRTHDAGALRAEHVGQTVTLAGWVARRRDHGGVAFLDLREASGVVQVVVRDEEVAHSLRSEYCIKVTGQVSPRPEGNANPNLPSGDVEVIADDVEGMLDEGRHFAKIAPNIVVKVAMSENGLEAISRFADEGIKTNCTLIFTANQGLLAAKAGASLLSPFVGRLDDINQDGMQVIRDLAEIVAIHELDTEVLAASIRNPLHMTQAALAGAHVATLPFKILQQMVHHPLTDKGIEQFKADWTKAREVSAAKV